MSTISVPANFAAGHRILGLEGAGAKCRNIHGHNFKAVWTFEQHGSIEFGNLKRVLRDDIIRHHFDHVFILDKSDDFLHYLQTNMLRSYTLDFPPTTENIAHEIAVLTNKRLHEPHDSWGKPTPEDKGGKVLLPNAQLLEVRLEEGPDNVATWQAAAKPAIPLLGGSGAGGGATWTNGGLATGITTSLGAGNAAAPQ